MYIQRVSLSELNNILRKQRDNIYSYHRINNDLNNPIYEVELHGFKRRNLSSCMSLKKSLKVYRND